MNSDDNRPDSESNEEEQQGKPGQSPDSSKESSDQGDRPRTVLRQGTTSSGDKLSLKDIPKELGNLRLIKKIGHEGGMGIVFQAQNINLDSERAVKILHPMLSQRPDIARSFVREAQITDKLDHPNIVRVYEVGTFNEYHFIEMELIDTFELPPNNQLPIDIALIVCLKVCEALQFSHTASFKHQNQQIDGVIHRDVKPGNILISKSGQVKLADFGIAKLSSTENLTIAGMGPVGTFAYMSPEQLNDEKNIDRRTDIYSLGVVLYEYIAGKPAFAGSVTNIMANIAQNKFAPLSSIRKDIPKGVDQIVRKAMARDRNARYQSTKEMRDDIFKYLLSVGIRDYDDRLRNYIRRPSAVTPIKVKPSRDYSKLIKPAKQGGLVIAAIAVLALVIWGVAGIISWFGTSSDKSDYENALGFIEAHENLVIPDDSVQTLIDTAVVHYDDEDFSTAASKASNARLLYKQKLDSCFTANADSLGTTSENLISEQPDVIDTWSDSLIEARRVWQEGEYHAAFSMLASVDSLISTPQVVARITLQELRERYSVKPDTRRSFSFTVDDQGIQVRDLRLEYGQSGLSDVEVYLDGGFENPTLHIDARKLEPGRYRNLGIIVENIEDQADSHFFDINVQTRVDSLTLVRKAIDDASGTITTWKNTYETYLTGADIFEADSVLNDAQRLVDRGSYHPAILKATEANNRTRQSVIRRASYRIDYLTRKTEILPEGEALSEIVAKIDGLRSDLEKKKYLTVLEGYQDVDNFIENYLATLVVEDSLATRPLTPQELKDSAGAYANMQDWPRTLEYLASLEEIPDESLPAETRWYYYYLEAKVNLHLKELNKAEEYCKLLREFDPRNFYGHYLSGLVAFSRKQYDRVIPFMDEARLWYSTILVPDGRDFKDSEEWHHLAWHSNMAMTEMLRVYYTLNAPLEGRNRRTFRVRLGEAVESWDDYINSYGDSSIYTGHVKLGRDAKEDLRLLGRKREGS